ncbi:MAG: RNA-binding S4 domain-containing protein [Solirubrobacteraceae bacterium]
MRRPRDIAIREDTIRLGQLLKLAGLADSGAEARALVQDAAVRVNGEIETRRGRQLRAGDVVEVGGERVRVAA